MCQKCDGLTGAFGWNGNVKVADETGKILYAGANDIFYGDFYRNEDPAQWPVCPECGRSLDAYEAPKQKDYVPAWLAVVGIIVPCLLIWGGFVWMIYARG